MLKKTIMFICFYALFLFVISTLSAHAVDWSTANQATVQWGAVTQTSEGTPIPAGDVVKYQVYIVKEGADKASAVTAGGEIEALEYTLTFPSEGRWLPGVQTVRYPEASPTDVIRSPITWGDSEDVTKVPVPFGYIYFEAPAQPGGFGPQ